MFEDYEGDVDLEMGRRRIRKTQGCWFIFCVILWMAGMSLALFAVLAAFN